MFKQRFAPIMALVFAFFAPLAHAYFDPPWITPENRGGRNDKSISMWDRMRSLRPSVATVIQGQKHPFAAGYHRRTGTGESREGTYTTPLAYIPHRQ